MNDGSGAERCVRAERTATLKRLGKLVGLSEISFVVGVVHSIVETAGSQRIPRINTERATKRGAGLGHLRLATLIADHRPTRGRRAIAEGHAFDLDGGKSRPRCGIVR